MPPSICLTTEHRERDGVCIFFIPSFLGDTREKCLEEDLFLLGKLRYSRKSPNLGGK